MTHIVGDIVAMDNEFEKIYENAVYESRKVSVDDLLAFGFCYFTCGSGNLEYYNNKLVYAISIVGACNKDKPKCSDYRNGVDFLARKAKVSKRQVKILRKKTPYRGHYAFKTPYSIDRIVREIIEWFISHKELQLVKDFLSNHRDELYRDYLISKQYSAIESAANLGKRKIVRDIYDEMRYFLERMED